MERTQERLVYPVPFDRSIDSQLPGAYLTIGAFDGCQPCVWRFLITVLAPRWRLVEETRNCATAQSVRPATNTRFPNRSNPTAKACTFTLICSGEHT